MQFADDSSRSHQFTGQSLYERLTERGWEFDFFRAVWLLERHGVPKAVVGGRGPVGDEMIRFRPHSMVGFPSTDIRRVRPLDFCADENPVLRFDVTFMGLYGVATPLPLHMAIRVLRSIDPEPGDIPGYSTQDAIAQRREAASMSDAESPSSDDSRFSVARSSPVRDFLDLFHHRLISYFYRAWTKYRFDVSFGVRGRDDMTRYLLRLGGISPDSSYEALGVAPVRMLRYIGLQTQHPRSAVSLEGILNDYWEQALTFGIDQHVGRWVPLPREDFNSIGLGNSRLGEDLTVGEQVFDLSGAFNVAIGPVDWNTYLQLLPDNDPHMETRALVRLYCSDPLQFTVEIKLEPESVPEMQLGSGAGGPRLGLTSWVRTRDVPATSVVFSEASCAASRFMSRKGGKPSSTDPRTSHAVDAGADDRENVTVGLRRTEG